MVWPPWASGVEPFWIGFWVNIFTVPTTVFLAALGFFFKNLYEKGRAVEENKKRQLQLITLVRHDLNQNQYSMTVTRGALAEDPVRIAVGEAHIDVWKSVQAEMVSLGLPMHDLTFPTIGSAFSFHVAIRDRSLMIEKLSLDITVGQTERADDLLNQLTNGLATLLEAAEAETSKAIDFLEGYANQLREGGVGEDSSVTVAK